MWYFVIAIWIAEFFLFPETRVLWYFFTIIMLIMYSMSGIHYVREMKTFKVGRKSIGTYNETTGIFYKEVSKSKHLFRVLDAWGIDAHTLETLPETARIIIDDKEERKRYEVSKMVFDTFGEYYHFKGEEDHKVQKFLRRASFTVTDLPTPEKPRTQAEIDRAEYMRIFGA